MTNYSGYFTSSRRLALVRQLAQCKETYTAQGEQRERRSAVMLIGTHFRVGYRLDNGDNHYQYVDSVSGDVLGADNYDERCCYADSNIIKECEKWNINAIPDLCAT